MNNEEILKFCLEKGLLLDNDVLNLFSETDEETAKIVLEKIKNYTHKRVITKEVFDENKDKVSEVVFNLPEEKQKKLENFKIKLGLSIEISRSKSETNEFSHKIKSTEELKKSRSITIEKSGEKTFLNKSDSGVRVSSMTPTFGRALEVKDFVNYFRGRVYEMKNILQDHAELKNAISINKISGNRQGISIIGIVYDKRTTKNKNIILELEDITGRIKVLINKDKKELYEKAEDIALDAVIGVRGSGSREIIFANDVVFPEAFIPERKKSHIEEYALFIGDLHYGSQLFMRDNFLKFIDYLNGKFPDTPEVNKIKYLFIVGDAVAGVGNYPNQEEELEVKDLEEQFLGLAELLGQIRKDIKIIISPGNHDGVRIMEPQPVFDEKYAWPLYEMKNVTITTNPAQVNIAARKDFSGFDVLTYHGFSYFYYTNNVPKLMLAKAANSPEMIMKYLLMHRHLAPTHGSTQYFPLAKDPFLIRKVPDIIVSGHTHKSAITYYNNILIISISSWESLTAYMEKVGSKPDFCKVPMFNLKTREVRILDFE